MSCKFESLIGSKGGKENVIEANAAKGRPSSSKNKCKAIKRKNIKNNKGKGKGPATQPITNPQHNKECNDGLCFNCSKSGHWSHDCTAL